ncbi:hypothetical protein FACS1894206_05220 [Deltaproteobacteria bacterium]|nr:hypothetical protein FACS1894206_05220 [Deltaproteobacteria bacterium]
MRIVTLFSFFCLLLVGCVGGTGGAAKPSPVEADKADSQEIAAISGTIEISIGMHKNRVLALLGTATDISKDEKEREVWRYNGKRAEFVYASNRNNVQTLVIGGYMPSPTLEERGGMPLLLRIVLDPAHNVADFNFSQINF